MLQLQQGDVNITQTTIPEGARKRKGLTLREGEVTGHAHRVMGEAELLEIGDRLFLRVLAESTKVVHEEHTEILVPPGEYEINPTVEYDHFTEEAREVRD